MSFGLILTHSALAYRKPSLLRRANIYIIPYSIATWIIMALSSYLPGR